MGRGACPSCGQKRALVWAGRMVEEVLPIVPYRQLVFTIPRNLRWPFFFDRSLYGELSRIAYSSTRDFLRREADGMFRGVLHAVPAMIACHSRRAETHLPVVSDPPHRRLIRVSFSYSKSLQSLVFHSGWPPEGTWVNSGRQLGPPQPVVTSRTGKQASLPDEPAPLRLLHWIIAEVGGEGQRVVLREFRLPPLEGPSDRLHEQRPIEGEPAGHEPEVEEVLHPAVGHPQCDQRVELLGDYRSRE